MIIVTDDSNAGHAGGPAQDAGERALAAVISDPVRIGDLLDELSRGRLWLPLPDDGQPVTDGSAVHLPTLRYLGLDLVPAFTSGARVRAFVPPPAAEAAHRGPRGRDGPTASRRRRVSAEPGRGRQRAGLPPGRGLPGLGRGRRPAAAGHPGTRRR